MKKNLKVRLVSFKTRPSKQKHAQYKGETN